MYKRSSIANIANNKQSKGQYQFFNESFYKEKEFEGKGQTSQQSYVSYEYVKKYFEATQINTLVTKNIKTVLNSSYLPQNPYNIIGRLLVHESIFENIKIFYEISSQRRSEQTIKNQIQNTMGQHSIFVKMQVKDKIFQVPWKLKNILSHQRLQSLWVQIFQREGYEDRRKAIIKQYKVLQIVQSLGGSYILKVGKPFSAEQVVTATSIYYMEVQQNGSHINKFSELVIDQCMRIGESSNHFFIKLQIYCKDESSIEWSIQDLIHNPTKVGKQIMKTMLNTNSQLWTQYILKIGDTRVKKVKIPFLRIRRVFVLIQKSGKKEKIHTVHPFSLLLNSCFMNTQYLDTIKYEMGNSWSFQSLIHFYEGQQHYKMIQSLQKQQPSWVGWIIYFYELYQLSKEQFSSKQLFYSLDFLINSPLGFLNQLQHYANVAKLISSKSSFSTSENQIYSLVQHINRIVQLNIKKQEHIYPEMIIFFHAVKTNLDLILEKKTSKFKQIKPILNRVQNLIKNLANSFYQICFVQKGVVLKEIIRIDNIFGKDGSAQIISNLITYDIFLRKYKNFPQKTLNMNEEVPKLKKKLNCSPTEAEQLLIAKYIKNYELYDKIYNFYWNTICGKKLKYPMSKFINTLHNQAIRFDYLYGINPDFNYDVQETKFEGIVLYKKAADAKSKYLFYSLIEDALDDQKVKDYRTVLQLFQNFFRSDLLSELSSQNMSHLRKNSYIVSINSKIREGRFAQSNFNRCKIYIDVVYHVPINKADTYRIITAQLIQKVEQLDKNEFGVLGVYAGKTQEFDEDEVFSWTQQEQKFNLLFIRFNSKRSLNLESLNKLVRNCEKTNSQILIKIVFSLKGFIKCCIFSFNFLINSEWFLNKSHSYNERVFSSFDDITRWSNYNNLKKYLSSKKKIESSKEHKIESRKNLYLQNKIDMIEFITQESQTQIDSKKIRKYSRFYGQLEQALSIAQNIFDLFEFLKVDRRGKFEVGQFKQTLQMLQYHLFDKCLKMDRYIYSEGLSVTIINIMTRINEYIQNHQDNNGQQKELIYLQKLIRKLMNCIHYSLSSCGFGVLEAVKSDYIQQS